MYFTYKSWTLVPRSLSYKDKSKQNKSYPCCIKFEFSKDKMKLLHVFPKNSGFEIIFGIYILENPSDLTKSPPKGSPLKLQNYTYKIYWISPTSMYLISKA